MEEGKDETEKKRMECPLAKRLLGRSEGRTKCRISVLEFVTYGTYGLHG